MELILLDTLAIEIYFASDETATVKLAKIRHDKVTKRKKLINVENNKIDL
jgi:hypothetical protein